MQFFIGMSANLFINIPINGSFNFFGYTGGFAVLAHIINGSLILALGCTIILLGYRAKDLFILRLSATAVVLTILAITFGTLFLEAFSIPSLYNVGNYFSLAMAMSFLFIFTVFFLDLYSTKKSPKSS